MEPPPNPSAFNAKNVRWEESRTIETDDQLMAILREAKEKSKNFKAKLTQDPALANRIFRDGRSLLHVAITMKADKVAKILANANPALIGKPDKSGKTPYHYSVIYDMRKILSLFIGCAKEKADVPDEEGDTALHLAIDMNKEWAVKELIEKGQANIFIKNNKALSPIDKAQGYPNLLNHFTQTAVNEVEFRRCFPCIEKRLLIPKSFEEYEAEFRSLNLIDPIEAEKDTSQDSEESHSKVKLSSLFVIMRREEQPLAKEAFTYQQFKESSIETIQERIRLGWNGIDGKTGGGQPILCQFLTEFMADLETKPEDYHQRTFEKLILLLRHIKIDDFKNDILTIIEQNPKNAGNILYRCRYRLRQVAFGLLKSHAEQMERANEQIEKCLFSAGLKESYPVLRSTKIIPSVNEEKNQVVDLLLKVCSGITSEDKKTIRFDKLYVAQMTQGLLSFCKPHRLIRYLNKLYNKLDFHEQLIANFIVKEILFWDLHIQHTESSSLLPEIQQLKQANQKALKQHGDRINAAIENMRKIKRKDSIEWQNFLKINELLHESSLKNQRSSFLKFLEEAVEAPDFDRKNWISKIAEELRMLSLFAFQKIEIKEMYDQNWTKDKQPELFSNIKRQQNFANQLSESLSCAILKHQQPQRMIQVLLEVGAELALARRGCGPDIGTIQILIGVLSSANISRMQSCFDSLSSKDKQTYEALQKLIDAKKNGKWMRLIETAYSRPLVSLAHVLKDIMFIHERAGNFEAECKALGDKFFDFLRLQRELMQIPCMIRSDLLSFISEYRVSERELYLLSCKVALPILQLDASFDLKKYEEEMADFTARNFIPKVIYNGMHYSPESSMEGIARWLKDIIRPSLPIGRQSVIIKQILFDCINRIEKKFPEVKINRYRYLRFARENHLPMWRPSNPASLNISTGASEPNIAAKS